MARRIDEVQLIDLTVTGLVIKRHALGLDGNAPLPLKVHGVEYLLGHFAIGQPAADLDKAVGQGRFAVVDVRDDGEISYTIDVVIFFGFRHSSKSNWCKHSGVTIVK